MNPTPQNSGNALTDGLMLCLVAAGGWLSELTMSSYIAFITAIGGTFYALNQLLAILKNIKKKHHDGPDKTVG
jgi:hypothetical protein